MKKTGKKKKSSHRGKFRKGGLGAIDITSILAVVAGAAGAGFADKIIPETIDKRIVAGGKIVLGAILPMLSKSGSTKNMLAGVGNGLISVGTIELLKGFGVLGAAEETLEVDLSGTEDVLAGMDEISVMNGEENVLAGDDLSIINGMDYEDEE